MKLRMLLLGSFMGCAAAPPPSAEPAAPLSEAANTRTDAKIREGAPHHAASKPDGVAAACFGSALDLDVLVGGTDCDVEQAPKAVAAAALRAFLSPAPLDTKSGGQAAVTMVIENVAKETTVMDLSVGCPGPAFEAWARSGKEVVCGGLGMRCPERTVRIALPPGGRASAELRLTALSGLDLDDCPEDGHLPLPPGRYALEASTHIQVDPPPEPDAPYLYARGALRVAAP
jgi:hypothetical protein